MPNQNTHHPSSTPVESIKPVQSNQFNNLKSGVASYHRPNSAGPGSGSDAEQFFLKYKMELLTTVVVLIVAVLGYSLYTTQQEKKDALSNEKIYQFKMTTWENYKKGNDTTVLISGYNNLQSQLGNFMGLVPVGLDVSGELINKNQNEEAKKVLLSIKDLATKNEYSKFLVYSRLAVLFENIGQNKEAIDLILDLNQKKDALFSAKNYLDLGRLYLKTNEMEKAKSSFKFIIDNEKKDSEIIKEAKLYLTKIK